MTPEHAAAVSRSAVHYLGDAFTECPVTVRHAQQRGLSGWSYHVASRAGVLGYVSTATVTAALGMLGPELVRDAWEYARRLLPPTEIAAQRAAECCRWGTAQLDRFPAVNRLVGLTGRMLAAADATAMPLFAAWRALPSPDVTPGARAATHLHLLREHRRAAYLIAVRAGGLTPVEALVAGPEGEAAAAACGWAGPYPRVGPLLRRRMWTEAVTDRLAGQPFTALSPAERAELVDLLDEAAAGHFDTPASP
ncbi:SCO6745 family protein [Pilimelia terevasa]|uniref:SCO6745 family protein n=1 Tax=Pilimelia terevasa TaxID=53372 RepID=UPI001669AE62|nr:hypothetical protein [Pilimelia terevasa]